MTNQVVSFEDELADRERGQRPDERSQFEKDFPEFTREMINYRTDPAIQHAYAHTTMMVEMLETRRFNEMSSARKFFNKSITHFVLHQRLASAMAKAFLYNRSAFVGVLDTEIEELLKRVETNSVARVRSIIREALDSGWLREVRAASRENAVAYYLTPESFFWWMSVSGRDYHSIQRAAGIDEANARYAAHLEELDNREPPIFDALRRAYEKDCGMAIDYTSFNQR